MSDTSESGSGFGRVRRKCADNCFYVAEVATRAPLVAAEYREKLTAKVQEYLADVKMDEGRLLTEVAVFTDKSNIDEELTRLRSHIEQFRSIAEEGIVVCKTD